VTGDRQLHEHGLPEVYRAYISCLNRQDWEGLGDFVKEDVRYNGDQIGLSGYRRMLEDDFRAIPDLHFDVALVVCDPPYVASRLDFDCTPTGELFALPVNGKRIRFSENVFYEFDGGRIAAVLSIIDKSGIAAQL
jgi:predicted ester cyclase